MADELTGAQSSMRQRLVRVGGGLRLTTDSNSNARLLSSSTSSAYGETGDLSAFQSTYRQQFVAEAAQALVFGVGGDTGGGGGGNNPDPEPNPNPEPDFGNPELPDLRRQTIPADYYYGTRRIYKRNSQDFIFASLTILKRLSVGQLDRLQYKLTARPAETIAYRGISVADFEDLMRTDFEFRITQWYGPAATVNGITRDFTDGPYFTKEYDTEYTAYNVAHANIGNPGSGLALQAGWTSVSFFGEVYGVGAVYG